MTVTLIAFQFNTMDENFNVNTEALKALAVEFNGLYDEELNAVWFKQNQIPDDDIVGEYLNVGSRSIQHDGGRIFLIDEKILNPKYIIWDTEPDIIYNCHNGYWDDNTVFKVISETNQEKKNISPTERPNYLKTSQEKNKEKWFVQDCKNPNNKLNKFYSQGVEDGYHKKPFSNNFTGDRLKAYTLGYSEGNYILECEE